MKRRMMLAMVLVLGSTPALAGAAAPARPIAGRLTVRLPDIFVLPHDAVTVPGRVAHVVGVVRPYVSGQWVSFRATESGRLIKATRYRVKPLGGGRGGFTAWVSAPSPGVVHVTVIHARDARQVGFLAGHTFRVLAPTYRPGATGRFVQLIQQRLAELHLYIPQTGVLDYGTELALDAYHRLLHWGTSPALDGATMTWLLNGRGSFHVRFPSHGRHAEGDLSQQLLVLANGPRVSLIFPISSGKPSTPTILGDYRIYQRDPGYLPDGMYFSSFFIRGYAIHGYDPAPDYPASHGCMRLPIVDAITAFNWLALGDWVDVY